MRASAETANEDETVEATEVPAAATAELATEPVGTPAVAPSETPEAASAVPVGESTLPEELTAQLDTFLQSQVYTEGGYAEGAAPGLVLLNN